MMIDFLKETSALVSFDITPFVIQLFKRLRWSTMGNGAFRFQIGDNLRVSPRTTLHPYVGFYAGKTIPRVKSFTYSFSAFDTEVQIGAYCSIANQVQVIGPNHPLEDFSTSAALYQDHLMFQAAYADSGINTKHRSYASKALPVIGNDVWIGQNVLLGRGISIGDGAVVAAGSVVVKDVPAYAIVGGCPAKLIRYRFEKAIRDDLQALRWWDYMMPDLMRVPMASISDFIGKAQAGIADGSIRPIRRFESTFVDILRSSYLPSHFGELEAPVFQPLDTGALGQKMS